MKLKITLLGMSLALLGATSARGQSIWPSTLNAAGGYVVISGIEFDYSIGEIALVSTFTTPSVVVTQGLLQTDLGDGSTGVNTTSLVSKLQVFPNPANAIINIQFNAAAEGSLSLKLMDIAGKVVMQQKADIKQGANLQKMDIAAVATAIYMLEATFTPTEGKPETNTYKIQKFQ